MHKESAYVLTHDVERFVHYDTGYEADLLAVDTQLSERLAIFDDKPIDISIPVIYSGYPPVIRTLDFPVTDNGWLVMSAKMLAALKSAGEFRHVEFPVVITDYRHLPEKWRDKSGNFDDAMIIDGYSVIQLLERLDIFDYEKSKYELDKDHPAYLGRVEEYVFQIPQSGLPPIFYIKGEPVKTFISYEARLALKKVETTGVQFVSLKGMQWGEGIYVDVPVPMPADE